MAVIAVLLVVVVNGALIAAVLRFRERRGTEPARFTAGRGALRPVIGALERGRAGDLHLRRDRDR